MRNGLISNVEPGSAAYEGGILPGDCLLRINNKKVRDVFDYQYLTADTYVELELEDSDGETYTVEIEKDIDEDLGLEFENPMMDDDKSCANRCIFCFIDQMPSGMRESLYFKDDDPRLSFLTGNYVTLTNISDKELERLCSYHLSPINVSVHTTNPELRSKMLCHKKAGDILHKLDIMSRYCVTVNAQIVLCPGINDGDELERTAEDLSQKYPDVAGVCVVPVGLTKFRQGLTGLRCFTKEECRNVVEQTEKMQKAFLKKIGTRFIFAADEFYLSAGIEIPPYENYEEFSQLQDGVGMMRLLDSQVAEFMAAYGSRLAKKVNYHTKRKISIATGFAAGDFIKGLSEFVLKDFPGIECSVYKIKNDFFGENITVAGLLTGKDIVSQLKGKDLGSELLITDNMMRAGENVFLDDLTTDDVGTALGVKLITVADNGRDFVLSLLGEEANKLSGQFTEDNEQI